MMTSSNIYDVFTYLFLIKTIIKAVVPTMTAAPMPIPANTSAIQKNRIITRIITLIVITYYPASQEWQWRRVLFTIVK